MVKPLFHGKRSGFNSEISLLEKDIVIRDENEVAKDLHFYFDIIISSLEIAENEYIIERNLTYSVSIDKATMKFQFHHKILLLKKVK